MLMSYEILHIGFSKLGMESLEDTTNKEAKDLLIKDAYDPLDAIVDSTYPGIREGSIHSSYFYDRAILAPTNEIVDKVNEHVL